jgi:hypothetical protein
MKTEELIKQLKAKGLDNEDILVHASEGYMSGDVKFVELLMIAYALGYDLPDDFEERVKKFKEQEKDNK